jgi:hypothetical protein
MSYFEPSRRPFERHRVASPSRTLDWIFDQPRWRRALLLIGLALYAGVALWLCGVTPAIGVVTGIATSLLLAFLLAVYRLGWPGISGLCFALIIGVGTLTLVLPGFVFLVMGLWLLVSLPLWLFRA